MAEKGHCWDAGREDDGDDDDDNGNNKIYWHTPMS